MGAPSSDDADGSQKPWEGTRLLTMRMHRDEIDVDEPLVRRLLVTQLPELGELPLAKVEPWGTDNAVWRLGDDLVVRLPRIHWAGGQADLEARWLPHLAAYLPVTVPETIALGEPDDGYPWRWSVQRWLPGQGAGPSTIGDPIRFALQLAGVVRALGTVPVGGAPRASNRARPLKAYHAETLAIMDHAKALIDVKAARALWQEALDAPPHQGPPVWVQGDLEGNCLVRNGSLSGIVDWGSACAGDPAVDVQVVWSPLFTDESRRVFIHALDVDDATLARSRGAAIHQACGALPYYLKTYPAFVERSWHKLAALDVGRSHGD